MKIWVRICAERMILADVSSNILIDSLVDLVHEKGGVPSDHRELYFKDKYLDPMRCLGDYNIKELSILHISKHFKGTWAFIRIFLSPKN